MIKIVDIVILCLGILTLLSVLYYHIFRSTTETFITNFINDSNEHQYQQVIIVTPAGRRRYLRHLLFHLKKQTKHFDVWHLWNNTRNQDDEEYIYELQRQYSWIKVIEPSNDDELYKKKGTNYGINIFWKIDASQSNTLYIRLDDDIVWLSPNFVSSMVTFKSKHKSCPIVYANIINNNYIDHLHQSTGSVLQNIPHIQKHCMGNLWKSPEMTHRLHEEFKQDRINNTYNKWIINTHKIDNFERVSINAIAWEGELFHRNDLPSIHDEEEWISVQVPKKLNKPTMINGDALALHFAFYTQRDTLVDGKTLDDRIDELLNTEKINFE
jgi:hypothetical protein